MSSHARLIAFYLPQYHPIPENDEWWGKGFTEWTNVTRAKPLYPGHHQPNLPSELGFYDLRVPEIRIAQAELAREHGIEGFAYWHYWFGNGRRLLERPFNEVLKSGEPNFPFCLSWANQSWTGIWHGSPNRVLMEQTYPGVTDYRAHFFTILDALTDERYITVDGKPIFIVYRPPELPNPQSFADYWRELAYDVGLKGLYLIGVSYTPWTPSDYGFDAGAPLRVGRAFEAARAPSLRGMNRFASGRLGSHIRSLSPNNHQLPKTISYDKAMDLSILSFLETSMEFPTVLSNWDNTPRSGANGYVFEDATPELFGKYLRLAMAQVAHHTPDERIVFIKSWNEWAEGNYIEPDQRFGRAYLQTVKQQLKEFARNEIAIESGTI